MTTPEGDAADRDGVADLSAADGAPAGTWLRQAADTIVIEIDYAIIQHFSQHLYGSPNEAVEELGCPRGRSARTGNGSRPTHVVGMSL